MLRRQWRLVLIVLATFLLFWLLYLLRSAILPFAVGLVLAYLLLPVIQWVEARLPFKGKWPQVKRVVTILFIFLIIIALVGFFFSYIVVAIINAATEIFQNTETIIRNSIDAIQQWLEGLRQQLPPEVQAQIDQYLRNALSTLGSALQSVVVRGIAFIPTTFGLIVGFAALPIFLFYILKDWERLSTSFYSWFPPAVALHVRNIIQITENVLGRYFRAQLLLGFVVAFLSFIGLMILQIPFAPVLAVFAGITELVPTIGPWIGGTIAVLVTLATEPSKVIWVVAVFLIVQLLENNLLVPRIHGGYLHVHPAIAIFLLVLGGYLAGFWGLLLAVPLTATIVGIIKYMHRNLNSGQIQ